MLFVLWALWAVIAVLGVVIWSELKKVNINLLLMYRGIEDEIIRQREKEKRAQKFEEATVEYEEKMADIFPN